MVYLITAAFLQYISSTFVFDIYRLYLTCIFYRLYVNSYGAISLLLQVFDSYNEKEDKKIIIESRLKWHFDIDKKVTFSPYPSQTQYILCIINAEHNKFFLNGVVLIPLYRIWSCYALFLYCNIYYMSKIFTSGKMKFISTIGTGYQS